MKIDLALIVWGASLGIAPAAFADSDLARLPAVIQNAIQRQVGTNSVTDASSNIENGSTTYDVEFTREGKEHDFTLDSTGRLLSVSEQVSMGELPPSVHRAVRNHVGKGRIQRIEKNTEGEEITYEIDMMKAGHKRHFTLDANGKLLEIEVLTAELPAPVRQAILDHASGATVESVSKVINEDEVTYEAELVFDSQTRVLTAWDNGDWQLELALSETPQSVRAALRSRLNDGSHVESISKTFQDGEITYEAELVKEGANRTVAFDPDGTLSYEEQSVPLSDTPAAMQKILAAASGKIVDISKCSEDGEISYRAKIVGSGSVTNMTFNAAGEPAAPDSKE